MLSVPDGSLIVLAGVSGAGKSTLAKSLCTSDMIANADFFRWMISGDENDQSVTPQAWEMTNRLIEHRLSLGKTTLVDSLALQPRARRSLVEMAKAAGAQAHMIMLWAELEVCLAGQQSRERKVPEDVVRRMFMQAEELKMLIEKTELTEEGFSSAKIIVREDMA